MEIYITEETLSFLLKSLGSEISKYYGKDFPVMIAVGISGVEIVGRLPKILGDSGIETYVCDVVRRGDAIDKVVEFPEEKVKGKRVLITYARVDTGRTMEALSDRAIKAGATDVKTLSIAVRNGSACFPHFFSFIIKDEDNLYLLLEGYPPDIPLPYPPVFVLPGDFIRELNHEDASTEWLKCGDDRIDKVGVGEYLYYQKISKNCRVFVVVEKGRVVGLLHFYTKPRSVRIETLAVSEKVQGQHIGTKLLIFFIDWCKFNGIRWVCLDAFKEREGFYKGLNFHKVKEFNIPSYGDFCSMKRRVF